MSLSRNSEGGIGEAAFLAAASLDAAKLEKQGGEFRWEENGGMRGERERERETDKRERRGVGHKTAEGWRVLGLKVMAGG